MDFFGRLRQLSSSVERDVDDTQRSFDLPQSEDDSTNGAALLLLQEIKNDVKKVRESARQSLQRLHEGPAFVEVVNAACVLMEQEKVLLAETEEYLQRYGYTPVLTPSVEIEHDGGDTNGDLGVQKQDPEDCSPVTCDSQPTPLTAGDSPIAPVLQSFAFAKNFSLKYKSSNDAQVPRMYSDQAVVTNQLDSGSVAADTDSPIPPVLQTPGIKKIERKLETTICGNYKGVISDDSPIPPVMQTPGVKQIMKVDRNGIADDNESSRQVGLVKSCHNGALSDDSPIPPVMQTPGVRQLNRFTVDKKGNKVDLPAEPTLCSDQLDIPEPPEMTINYQVAMDEKALPTEPTLSTHSDQMDTPEPPEMTLNYRDYVKLMTSRQPPAQVTGISRDPGGQSAGGAPKASNPNTTTSMYNPWTHSHGGTVAVVTPICRQTQSLKTTAVGSSLGAQYQRAMAEDTTVETPRMEEPTVPSNGFPASSWVDDDDDDLPAPPEMTMTLQHLINLKIRAPDGMRATDAGTASASLNTTDALPGTAPLSTTTSAPQRARGRPLRNSKVPLPTSVSQDPRPWRQVAEVTTDEYQNLPDYVTRSLSQQLVNTAVRSVNNVLANPSGNQRVRESCLHALLGSHQTKSFYLAMMSLGRLHCDVNHMRGEPVYFLPDL